MRILNRHTAYEALLTEHVDGVISAADDIKLSKHLATCAGCASDLREQTQIRTLLRAKSLVDVPRSFALPYAPRMIDAGEPTEITKLLRGMQVATASAAMVLVSLVGLSVMESSPFLSTSRTTASDASAPLAASALESEPLKTAVGAQGPADADAAIEENDRSASLASHPPADSQLMFEAAPEPSPDTAVTERISGGLLETDDRTTTTTVVPSEIDIVTSDIALAAGAAPTEDRPALEWALLAASLITALLALAVVAATWRARRA